MTGPVYTPTFLGECSLTLDSVEYGPIVSSAQFKPTPKTASFTGLDGNTTNFNGKPTWVLSINQAQDWATSGISTYMLANTGTKVVAVLTPTDGGPTFTATVTLGSPDIGGGALTVATSSIDLPVDGQPVQAGS